MSVNEVKIQNPNNIPKLKINGTGASRSRTFIIGNEDHTIGNSLRHVLIQNSNTVEFAGYSVPHPSEPLVNIRVQTHADCGKTAVQALQESCNTLHEQCQIVLNLLEEKLPEIKQDKIEIDKKILEITMEDDDDEEDEDGAMEE